MKLVNNDVGQRKLQFYLNAERNDAIMSQIDNETFRRNEDDL